KADSLKRLAIYGTVSGLIETDKRYVTAIESALGGAMQNIVVEREEDAKAAIEYLRRNNGGRATFLPVTSVKGRELDNIRKISACDGVIGAAHTLVKYDKKYDGVMKSLLGRVVVVDTMDNAIALSRKFGYKFRAVTLEGDILNAGGSMSGGSVNKQSGFLSRANEIKTLTSELHALSAEIRDLNENIKKRGEDMSRIDNQLSSYIPLVREYEDEILRLEASVAHMEETLDTGGETQQAYEAELLNIEKQLSESSDEIAKLLSGIRTLENEANTLQEKTEELSAEHEKITAEREERSQSIMEQTMTLGALQKDINIIQQSADTARKEIEESAGDIKRNNEEAERIRIKNDELYRLMAEKNALTEALKKRTAEIADKIKEYQEYTRQITDTLKDIQSSNKDLTDKLLTLQQEISRLENRIEKLTGDNESILSRLWDNYELTLSTAEEIKTEVEDEKVAAAKLTELRNAIKALGSINIDSIEEYVAVEERFKFLSEQKNDLEKSKADLNGIRTSMEELMQEHFEKQFAQIHKSFGEVFRELFGGGKGRLYLSQPDDILESGIEIEVQLPGKGLQNINLYSGGEKSFIAIALLFAILRVKPAPFCILDEIDAALDDVNVARFATYLKNYTDQTQFIVITHRRGTMEAANILYGVTMQEKGVSKLLSLHIDDVSDDMAN
ncbi:MAG: chromosome segregation protein SMC, partial [Clostridia bacterium]|nr:chromosome segregation protein SMC [Clostridia bacterium]